MAADLPWPHVRQRARCPPCGGGPWLDAVGSPLGSPADLPSPPLEPLVPRPARLWGVPPPQAAAAQSGQLRALAGRRRQAPGPGSSDCADGPFPGGQCGPACGAPAGIAAGGHGADRFWGRRLSTASLRPAAARWCGVAAAAAQLAGALGGGITLAGPPDGGNPGRPGAVGHQYPSRGGAAAAHAHRSADSAKPVDCR